MIKIKTLDSYNKGCIHSFLLQTKYNKYNLWTNVTEENVAGFLMLVDSLGSQKRFRSFGYNEKINEIRDFCPANNNGLIIIGNDLRSANYYSNSDDPYIAKLDSNWNFVWFKWLGERDDDYGGSLIKLSDGNYIAMVSSLKDDYYAREKLNFLKLTLL